MKFLFFASALRAGSCNKKFAREAMRVAGEAGVEGEFIDLKDYPMPPYDGDIETSSGVPQETKALGKKIAAADAVVLSTAEYNGSIPGNLKNVIDWLSRDKPVSLENKQLLLLAASPGALGGVRSLWHTRIPFEVIGTHVFPAMMGLSNAYNAFDEQGKLKEEKQAAQLKRTLDQFITYLKA